MFCRMLKHWDIRKHEEIDDHTLLAGVQDVVDESSGQLGYRNVTEKLRCIDWSQERKKNV